MKKILLLLLILPSLCFAQECDYYAGAGGAAGISYCTEQGITAEGVSAAAGTDTLLCQSFVASSSCTINKIAGFVKSASGTTHVYYGLYANDSGKPTGGTLASTPAVELSITATYTWVVGATSAPYTLTNGTTYHLCMLGDANMQYKHTTKTGAGTYNTQTYSGGLPNPPSPDYGGAINTLGRELSVKAWGE